MEEWDAVILGGFSERLSVDNVKRVTNRPMLRTSHRARWYQLQSRRETKAEGGRLTGEYCGM